MVRVKSNLDGDIHRFVLPDSPTFKQLHDQLAAIYSTTDFTVKYKDDEGDHVTVSSDEELQEAVSSVTDSGLLRVEVLRSTAAPRTAAPRNVTTAPATQPAAPPAPAAQPTASTSAGAVPSSNPNPMRDDANSGGARNTLTPEELMQGLGGMFAGLFGPFGMGDTGMRGMRRGGCHGGMRGMGCGGRRNRFGCAQPFEMRLMSFNTEDIERFVREFDPQAIGGDFANIQASTTEALRNLVAHLVRQSSLVDTLQALPAAMPLLRGFVAELRSDAPVTPARVEALATAVNTTLVARLGADNARRVADFVRTAAVDAAVQSILRRIPSGMSVDVDAGDEGSSASAGATSGARGRLDVHVDICCDSCSAAPIVGVRYWCTSQPNYDLCERCYQDDAVSKAGKTFRAIAYPWEAEPDRPLVPRPALGVGARGTEVRFLQHLLTNLGYMTPADYRFRAGVFGPRTAAALNAFRRDCGLPPTPLPVYDDVVAASLLSLIDAGIPPTAATGASAPPAEDSPAMDVDNAPTAA